MISLLKLVILVAKSLVVVSFDQVKFTADDVILENCRLARNCNSPNFFLNSSVDVSVGLGLDRVFEVNDVSESFNIITTVQITFTTDCIQKLIRDPNKWPVSSKQSQPVIMLDPKRYWNPELAARNGLENHDMGRPLKIVLLLNQMNGQLSYTYGGGFQLYCDFDFYYYPMDEQVCKVSLISFYPTVVAKIVSGAFLPLTDDYMPANTLWTLVGKEVTYSEVIYEGANYSQLDFIMHFERRSNWHILNLFGPSFIFCILELASFFIPGELPDRAAYNVTILLAFTVLQAQIVNSMPASPKPVVIQYYVFFEMVYTMLVTIYSCVFCWFLNHFPKQADRQVLQKIFGGMKLWQFVESLAFAMAIFFLTMLSAFGFIVIITKSGTKSI